MSGPLALVGGREWGDGCGFDADLLAASGASEVLVLPTAAAYEHPGRVVDDATEWFATLGVPVRGLMVLSHAEAQEPANVAAVRDARFIYLSSGSPLHLRSVLKRSAVWDAITQAWSDGAALAGSSAGAMVLGDPMVDPRGGAFTVGLGLVEQVAVLTDASTWSHESLRRTISLTADGVALLMIDERTAVIRGADGSWSISGVGSAEVHLGGEVVGLGALPA
ncbi:MAG: Type 1 glutamine amidotransferase-like domain-containing protein [Acidimicrobiales bacterium]